MNGKFTGGRVLIAATLILLAFVCVYPMWYTLIVSFSENAKVSAGKVWLWPVGVNLGSYGKMTQDAQFFRSFLITVARTALGVTINMLLMAFTAYPLCLPRGTVRGQSFYKWFLVANMLFSGGMIPAYMVVRNYGLINSLWALVLPCAVPIYNTILMMNFFKNVPYTLNEAARIDGAGPVRTLLQIYVPVSLSSLASLALFAFVGHWNAYFDGLLYINDNAKQPLQTYIYQISAVLDPQSMNSEQLREASKLSDITLSSAKVVISMVPIMAIYPFLQRYFVTGMTLGAVKE